MPRRNSSANLSVGRAGAGHDRRAQPPRPPERTPAVVKAQKERAEFLREREGLEHRSLLRGLILLALLVLAISLFRAGADRLFYAGWWRQW